MVAVRGLCTTMPVLCVLYVNFSSTVYSMGLKSHYNNTRISRRSLKFVYIVLILLMSLVNSQNHDSATALGCDKKLNIAAWNSRGLVAAVPYLRELMCVNDIICLSEHWLHSNRLKCLEDISDKFNVIASVSFHSDASSYGISRGQGGVALFWRKSLCGITPISEIIHYRICGVRVQTKDGLALKVCSLYMPAAGCSDDFESVLEEVAEIIDTDERGTCTILSGDFNADMGFLGGKRSTRKPTKGGRYLAKFFSESGLCAVNMMSMSKGPVNTFCSGVGKSTIDYIAVQDSIVNLVQKCTVIQDEILNTSDHYAVSATLELECGTAVVVQRCTPTSIKWN